MKNTINKVFKSLTLMAALSVFLISCGNKEQGDEPNAEEVKIMENEFRQFADAVQNDLGKAYTEYAQAEWNAAIDGTEEKFAMAADAEKKFNALTADKVKFEELKKFRESGMINDELMSRELDRLYFEFLGNQIDTAKLNAITELQSEISKKYQNYRAVVDGKKFDDNLVEKTLKTCKDSKKLEKVWKAHKDLGPVVAEDLVKLVKMRNETARELGFDNFHTMSLKLSDQDPEEISKLFDELDELTKGTFAELKNEIDEYLIKDLKIKKEELMPWHYQNRYFQEAPSIYEINLDEYYADKDLVKLTGDYYAGIGMPIEKMIAASDLFPREGKNQHAFCTDIDVKKKDIRILCNIDSSYSWMNTMLHEYGHGVYFKYQDETLPWILDQPAHIFTTEAIAMMFGRMASNPMWMRDMLGISDEEMNKIAGTSFKILKLEQLTFSRWAQVMYRFEKSMYANPDQDLNKLWWDLVEKYQMIKKPEGRNMPDWATKIHVATVPCYYHNYLLGELLASQLYNYINTQVVKSPKGEMSGFANNKEAGQYLIDKVFKPAARYYWNDMIEKATGEKLTAKYYADQFVN